MKTFNALPQAARSYLKRLEALVGAPVAIISTGPERDETIVGVCCGGGGYGRPIDRDPARVARDVAEGYVTRARAEAVYGVVLDAAGAVDAAATARRRAVTLSFPGRGPG